MKLFIEKIRLYLKDLFYNLYIYCNDPIIFRTFLTSRFLLHILKKNFVFKMIKYLFKLIIYLNAIFGAGVIIYYDLSWYDSFFELFNIWINNINKIISIFKFSTNSEDIIKSKFEELISQEGVRSSRRN